MGESKRETVKVKTNKNGDGNMQEEEEEEMNVVEFEGKKNGDTRDIGRAEAEKVDEEKEKQEEEEDKVEEEKKQEKKEEEEKKQEREEEEEEENNVRLAKHFRPVCYPEAIDQFLYRPPGAFPVQIVEFYKGDCVLHCGRHAELRGEMCGSEWAVN
ncbi:hypothetical protein EGR_10424 [Echinococcus granulosus]|uniref:Uncharacterized protein n=1 Tax=Echinococcus granulosus TaxID=6210 RepID=W6U0T1_ECHGR|nr:hypothetical protein EGR_10424 [Echinococcus granulosus]EUB54725.1 hypothetical protein EGR_10424 [Echinococcus granulosus]